MSTLTVQTILSICYHNNIIQEKKSIIYTVVAIKVDKQCYKFLWHDFDPMIKKPHV